MRTAYKVDVEHDEGVNPDRLVSMSEIVLNRILEHGIQDKTATEWLAEIVARLGAVAVTQLRVDEKLKGLNPDTVSEDEIFAYLNALVNLCAITMQTLTSLTVNMEKQNNELFPNDHE